MVDKTWLFAQGGRPVIYQPEIEYETLTESIRYRHVRYDPVAGIDVTWEREWRIRTDSLELDPRATTFVVPGRSIMESLVDEHVDLQRYQVSALGDVAAIGLSAYPWHFLSLDDLGLEIDFG